MADQDSVLVKIYVFAPGLCADIPPHVFLERSRIIKSVADILHSSILSLLHPGTRNNVHKLDNLVTDSIDSTVPPSEHAIVIQTHNDIVSMASSGDTCTLSEIRHSILSFVQEIRNVMGMISNHACPDRITLVRGSSVYLDSNILGHPDPLVIDTANKIRSMGKRTGTEMHLSVINDDNQEVHLTVPIPAKNKYKMDSDTEITKELIPRGFTRSKDGKWYVLFEDEQERIQYDVRSKNPDYHQILSDAYRHRLPVIVTYRGVRVIEAGEQCVIERKLVSLSESSNAQHYYPTDPDELKF